MKQRFKPGDVVGYRDFDLLFHTRLRERMIFELPSGLPVELFYVESMMHLIHRPTYKKKKI